MSREHACILDHILGRETWGERLALLGEQESTYGTLLSEAEAFEKVLRVAGVEQEMLVGICLPMSAEYVIALLAVYRAGGVSVLLNPSATEHEKQYILQHSQISFLVTQGRYDIVEDDPPVQEIQWKKLRLLGPFSQSESDVEPDDCLLLYTSGSTSRPKGVMLTKQSISANVRAVADYLALSACDRTIVFTPPAYAYAVSQVLTHLWSGGALLPWPSGLRSSVRVLQAIQEHQLTGIAANPTTFSLFHTLRLAHSISGEYVRYVMIGGQPLDHRVVSQIVTRFPSARIVNMYGCTENAPRIAFLWLPPDFSPRETSWPVGQPIHGTHLKIVDRTGKEMPSGQSGEILVSGTSLMRCYWREPALTAERIIDGWFSTRDLGLIDEEGQLHLTGRIDNIINVGHEKVAPEEVEAVIASIEGVQEVGVAPVEDGLLGHVAVALLVVDTNTAQAKILQKVQEECIHKLSAAKRPRQVVVVERLPKTLYGKRDRQALAEQARQMCAPGQRQRRLL